MTTVLAPAGLATVPAIVASAGERAGIRFLEFFASAIRNPHTRRAYARAASDFLAWCADAEVASIAAVQPLHVAGWIELQTRERSAPTVKLRLAAIRHLFDWLVTGQVIPTNPAASVRGPSHSARKGRTPVLDPPEARLLLDSIDVGTPIGLRDRALIGLMVFSFARIGAALGMRVEDVFVQNRRLWVRLREKGGKRHEMPCHHTLEVYLHAYLEQTGIGEDPKGPLFQTIGRGTGLLSRTPLPQANAYLMVQRRAVAAGIGTRIGNHSFRATGITAYLRNGGTLENAAAMANHASTRTTQLYDRRQDEISLDEVERIRVRGCAETGRFRHPRETLSFRLSPRQSVFLRRGAEQDLVEIHLVRLADREGDDAGETVRRYRELLVEVGDALGHIRLADALRQLRFHRAWGDDRCTDIVGLDLLAQPFGQHPYRGLGCCIDRAARSDLMAGDG